MIKPIREIIFEEDYALVPLTQGYFSKIDIRFIPIISKHNWCFSTGYAVRSVWDGKTKKMGREHLHRLILGLGPFLQNKIMTDHINKDRLDNRFDNLRMSTCSQNLANSGSRTNSTSKYNGVSFNTDLNKWATQISYGGNHRHLGYFETEESAARKYDIYAYYYHKEFATLNFPTEVDNIAEQLKINPILPYNPKTNREGYIGVTKEKHLESRPYRARIKIDGQKIHLGCFEKAECAGRAYDKAVIKYCKRNMTLNFPHIRDELLKELEMEHNG